MIKKTAKKFVRSLGWDIHRFSPSANHGAQLLAALNYVGANLVFDIGANVGQFAQDLRSAGFAGNIVSFEPLSIAHEKLTKAARRDISWHVHPRAALGNVDSQTMINIAGNSVSSSVLPMLDSHSSAATESAYIAAEATPLLRLDSVSPQYLNNKTRSFIKIDTQGFEWQVLDGAVDTLSNAQGIMLEASLVPLYEGQRLWRDLIHRMETEGFTLWAIHNGFVDHCTGRSLQVDVIFIRNC
jgi:FkbM family methyltransferase